MLLGNYFANRIVNRGYNYYLKHKVNNIVKNGDCYCGTVEGSENYQVSIEVSSDSRVIGMSCTCPYAQKGKKCKHEAAMLFEIFGIEAVLGKNYEENEYDDDYYYDNDYDFDDENDKYVYESREYQDHPILGKLELKSKSEILNIILLALNDSTTYQIFENIIDNDNRYLEMEKIIKQKLSMDKDIKKSDYQIILKAIKSLKQYKQYNEMIDLCELAITQLINLYSNTTVIQNQFLFDLVNILEECSSFDLDKVISVFHQLCIQYNHNFIYQLIDYLNKQNYSLNFIIHVFEERIEDKGCFYKNEIMKKYLYILFHYQNDQLDEAIKKYYDDQSFKLILIYMYKENKNYDQAEKVCLDGIQQSHSVDFYHLLIDIYQKTNQKNKLINVLKQLLCRKQGNVEYYKQLKQLYNQEEWQKEKQEIITYLEKQNNNIIDIYLEEKMYYSLMKYFKKTNDVIQIKKYEDILFKNVPKDIIEFYENYIYKVLKKSGTREIYQQMSSYLKSIARYDFDKAEDIYHQLELLYPKRYAMLEEMKIERSLSVQLIDIIFAIENSSNHVTSYYNKKTQKIVSLFEELIDQNLIDEIDENWDQYIALLSSYDVHEYQIMQDFILNLKNKDIRDQLWNTIHGKGAFRRFKDLAARFGILEDWFLYLNQQYRKIAIKWCRENNIIYVE